jgi:hypothetical protein
MMREGEAGFGAALDDCVRRLRAGEPLERCLADYPADHRAEIARLAPLAARVAGLASDPAPAFQERLEARLRAAVEVERQVRRRSPRPGLLGRLFTAAPARVATIALVTCLLLLVGGGGALQAAEDSLPDNPLYRVKEAREATELWIARDDEARAGVLLRQLLARGRELGEAVRTNRPRAMVELLALRVAEATDRIVDRALALHARGIREPARRALLLVREMQRIVDRGLAQAPLDSRPALRQLRDALEAEERRLTERGVAGPTSP